MPSPAIARCTRKTIVIALTVACLFATNTASAQDAAPKHGRIMVSNTAVALLLAPLLSDVEPPITYNVLSPNDLHGTPLAPSQLVAIGKSDLVVVLDEKNIETGLRKTSAQINTPWVRLRAPSDGRHFWHDPTKYLRAQHRLANILIRTYPSQRAAIAKSRDEYRAQVDALRVQTQQVWASATGARFLMPYTELSAYGKAFGILIASIETGGEISEKIAAEPDSHAGHSSHAHGISPRQQKKAIAFVKKHDIKIIVESAGTTASPAWLRLLAREHQLCLSTHRVYGDNPTSGMDYLAMMAHNTQALQMAINSQQCVR